MSEDNDGSRVKQRSYFGPRNRIRTVTVLSRRRQEQCDHFWKDRPLAEVTANWKSVCMWCGMTARGRRSDG